MEDRESEGTGVQMAESFFLREKERVTEAVEDTNSLAVVVYRSDGGKDEFCSADDEHTGGAIEMQTKDSKRRRGRGRGRGAGRIQGSKLGGRASGEMNESLGKHRGRGRKGRGRGRGRGNAEELVKEAVDMGPKSHDATVGREDDVAADQSNILQDEFASRVNADGIMPEVHNRISETRLPRMRGQVVRSRGRGRGRGRGNLKAPGKGGLDEESIAGVEESGEIGNIASEDSDSDSLLEPIIAAISSEDGQRLARRGRSTEPNRTETRSEGVIGFSISQRAAKHGLLLLEDGKGDRETHFTPEMEEIIRIWLSEIIILSFWPVYAQLAAMSPELLLMFDGSNVPTQDFTGFKLPLFKSAMIATSAGAEERYPRSCKDILLHVGGAVWALDWCPQRPGWVHSGAEKMEFLAVGAHPKTAPYNRMGKCLSGEGLIQIWALDLVDYNSDEEEDENAGKRGSVKSSRGKARTTGKVGSRGVGRGRGRGRGRGKAHDAGDPDANLLENVKTTDSTERQFPKWDSERLEEDPSTHMVLGIAHEGLVTWDAKWQPVGDSEIPVHDREVMRLGFLAVILGDGTLQVFDVPLPSIFTKTGNTSWEEPLIVNLEPVFKCSNLQKRGNKSIPVSLEWSTWYPHDRLLVGFHDASVGLWKFHPTPSATETRPLLFFQADSLPLRSVAWAPDGSGPYGNHLIVTAGHSGWVKFWDLRDIFRPIWDLQTSRSCISSMDWLPFPRCVLMSMDDGTLRLLGIDNASSTTPATGEPWRGTHSQGIQCYLCSSFAIWSVQVSRGTGLVAYAGASGSVLQFQLTEKAILKEGARAREPHFLCGAFKADCEDGPLTLISAKANVPVQMKKSSTEWGNTPTSKRNFLASCTLDPVSGTPTDSRQLALKSEDASVPKAKRAKGIAATGTISQVNRHRHAQKNSLRCNSDSQELVVADESLVEKTGEEVTHQSHNTSTSTGPPSGERFPCRNVGVHRVRWNCSHNKRQWLAYGGAAGLVRCQQVYSMKKKK